MIHIKSLNHFTAYNNVLEDYKKLEFYFKEYKEKKDFSERKILNILLKEINSLLDSIVENKLILEIDSSEDKALLVDINEFIKFINKSTDSKKDK